MSAISTNEQVRFICRARRGTIRKMARYQFRCRVTRAENKTTSRFRGRKIRISLRKARRTRKYVILSEKLQMEVKQNR